MEDYDVVANDESKVGHAVEERNGFLIVESGAIRKTRHAVPLDMARTDANEHVVRLTISKEMLEEGPSVENGETDWQAVEDYYGHTAELEGQSAGIESSDEGRAQMRESLAHPEAELGPRKGAVGVHQDEWKTKE